MTPMTRAWAKVNWTLAVLGRRTDGYHDLESLVIPVTLDDELLWRVEEGKCGFSLECDAPDLPTDERNLVVRAARLLMEEARRRDPGRSLPGVRCVLKKQIPLGGGLGGGSSDAATALRALNQIWDLRLPPERIQAIAAALGSDVPLFLVDGPAIIRGRGERVEPVELAWNGWIVLIVPGLAVSTAEVYRRWPVHGSDAGGMPRLPVTEVIQRFNETALEKPAVSLLEASYNMLEEPAMAVCPALIDIREQCRVWAGRPVRLTGSGSTLFTAFDDADEAGTFAGLVRKHTRLRTCVVRPVKSAERSGAPSA